MARSSCVVLTFAALTLAGDALAQGAATEADAIRARDDEIAELKRQVGTLADEVQELRTQVAVPDEAGLKSMYGLGPAASKIYGIQRGLSIGGYGEAFYRNFIGDSASGSDSVGGVTISDQQLDRADALRLVMYFGYKFSERILFNSEIEFEHATTEGTLSSSGGSASVEFMTLDFLMHDWANARAGLLLLPMGYLNELHEPPFFYGVSRPETETTILPTTWRENGAGLFGRLHETLEYRAYVVSGGFNARGFSDAGVRGGRQQGNRSLAEDLGFVVRLDWTPIEELTLGGSFYQGDSGQDQELAGIDVPDASLSIFELHAQWRRGGLQARTLFAMSSLSDARELNLALGRPLDRPIADKMLGGYAEVAYDVWPWLFGDAAKSLSPFVRVEYVDSQYEVPNPYLANRLRAVWVHTIGVNFKPHPNVVLKAEYRNLNTRDGARPDEVSLGMGFAF